MSGRSFDRVELAAVAIGVSVPACHIDAGAGGTNGLGVVFILNVTDINAAHEMLEQLPLGKAHLMTFELTPLGPLNPLRVLPGMTEASK